MFEVLVDAITNWPNYTKIRPKLGDPGSEVLKTFALKLGDHAVVLAATRQLLPSEVVDRVLLVATNEGVPAIEVKDSEIGLSMHHGPGLQLGEASLSVFIQHESPIGLHI